LATMSLRKRSLWACPWRSIPVTDELQRIRLLEWRTTLEEKTERDAR
jgi:hypothetical protein